MSLKINKSKFDSAIITNASYFPNSVPIYLDRRTGIQFYAKGNPTCSITVSVQGDEDCKKMMKLIQEYSIIWPEKEIN
jgi:hypothetical protein